MSDSMIERVVNAIRDSFNSNDIDCYPIAKAAIEAMREPTEEMICSVRFDTNMDHVQTYRAMIDAALKDGMPIK